MLPMSHYEHLLYETRGPVTIITINRPDRMNAIGPQTHRELVDAWDRFRTDDDALVGVLTGAGDVAFCAGGDLKAAFAGELPVDASPADGVLGPSRWTDVYKPTIAAVNGVAYAGGLEWACWTDLCVADEHATFGVTCRRWNIGLGDGGTQRLPRIVGHRVAMARFDDLLEVFIRVARIGRTSVTYEMAAYRVDDDLLMVTATQTLVLVDLEERKACPIPEEVRKRLRAFEGDDAEH